jgi:hypothetical protein
VILSESCRSYFYSSPSFAKNVESLNVGKNTLARSPLGNNDEKAADEDADTGKIRGLSKAVVVGHESTGDRRTDEGRGADDEHAHSLEGVSVGLEFCI